MSGNPQHTITIDGRVIELHPLRGRAARRMVPRLLTLASGLLYAASESGLNIREIIRAFADPSISPDAILSTLDIQRVILAINLICRRLEKEYEELEREVFPFLLNVEPEWLEEHGNLFEVYEAIFLAIRFHVQTSFGTRVSNALKKLAAGEEPAADDETRREPEMA